MAGPYSWLRAPSILADPLLTLTQIARTAYVDDEGHIQIKRELTRYESMDIPEAFLVVRT
jgi:hypothetical protein